MGSLLSVGAVLSQNQRSETKYSDQFDPHARASFSRAADIAAWIPEWAKAKGRVLSDLLSEAGAEEWLMFSELSAAEFKRPPPSSKYPSLMTRTLTVEILRFTGRLA